MNERVTEVKKEGRKEGREGRKNEGRKERRKEGRKEGKVGGRKDREGRERRTNERKKRGRVEETKKQQPTNQTKERPNAFKSSSFAVYLLIFLSFQVSYIGFVLYGPAIALEPGNQLLCILLLIIYQLLELFQVDIFKVDVSRS